MTAREVTLDVRGMHPPEPIVRVLETVGDFRPGDRLTLIVDCEPLPLYRILERNGYRHCAKPGAESRFEVAIWRDD
jgi:uncharacterized protein (DUF2249 family)